MFRRDRGQLVDESILTTGEGNAQRPNDDKGRGPGAGAGRPGSRGLESTTPDDAKDPTPAADEKPAFTIIKQKHSRWREVRDPENELMCLTVYRKGAREVVRRLAA